MDGCKTSIGERAICSDDAHNAMISGGLAPWQIRTLNAHIDAHLEGDITVDDLAGMVRLSVSHFGRAFKQSFGHSPHAHIIAERLKRARGLMLETSDSLAQIALAVGLADQSHLSRLFRQHLGETPFGWRRARWSPQGAGIVLQ